MLDEMGRMGHGRVGVRGERGGGGFYFFGHFTHTGVTGFPLQQTRKGVPYFCEGHGTSPWGQFSKLTKFGFLSDPLRGDIVVDTHTRWFADGVK